MVAHRNRGQAVWLAYALKNFPGIVCNWQQRLLVEEYESALSEPQHRRQVGKEKDPPETAFYYGQR